jgi:uncharacterized phage protein gp47/JayE
MPFDRPELAEIRERVKQDLANRLEGANPWLRVNNLRVFAEVEAGIAHLLFGRLFWSFQQLFPDTAEKEFLERWASIWGVRRSPATRASGPCMAISELGGYVQVDDLLAQVSPAPGAGALQYRITASVNEAGGQINFDVGAVDYGPESNLPTGTELRFLTVRPGVAPIATVMTPGIAGGAPADSDEELLAQLLRRIQAPPHGGAKHDYEQWMYEVSGVTRAWCYPLERGLGTVVCRFMMDDVRAVGAPGDPQGNNGIPTNGDCQVVWEYIDPRRPVTADLGPPESLEPPPGGWGYGYIFAPYPIAEPVTIGGLDPDTPETRAAIDVELRDMLRHETEPGATVYMTQYIMAIGNAPGVRRFRLVAPAVDVACQTGEIVVLGPLTFVP